MTTVAACARTLHDGGMPSISRTLPVSTEAAWAALRDIAAWPDWLPTVSSVAHVEGTPTVGVGASYAVEQPRLAKAVWTVTTWTEGSGFVWESRAPGVRVSGSHHLKPTSVGTIVDLGVTWSGPLAGLVRVAYRPLTQSYLEGEAQALGVRASESG